jgi:hypothetical protein
MRGTDGARGGPVMLTVRPQCPATGRAVHRRKRPGRAAGDTPFLPATRSWAARALQDHGTTVCVVSLPATCASASSWPNAAS